MKSILAFLALCCFLLVAPDEAAAGTQMELEKILGGKIESIVPDVKNPEFAMVFFSTKEGVAKARLQLVRSKDGDATSIQVLSKEKAMGGVQLPTSRVAMCAKICKPLDGLSNEICFWVCMIFD